MMEPMVHFSAQMCFISKSNSEPSPILSFALHFAILCDPKPPALRAPRLPAQVTLGPGLGHLRAKQLRRTFFAAAFPGAPTHPVYCSHFIAPCAASLLGARATAY